jgi:hypothetical protein
MGAMVKYQVKLVRGQVDNGKKILHCPSFHFPGAAAATGKVI